MATEQHPNNDYIEGSDASDTIDGGAGEDNIWGGAGNDLLIGGEGDDWLTGGDGNDLLVGGVGNDWLIGSGGEDTLQGGFGDDTYIWTIGLSGAYGGETEGNSVIADAGGTDNLRLMYTDDAISLVRSDDDLRLTADGKTMTIKDYFVTGENGGHIESIMAKCTVMDLQYVLDHLQNPNPGEEPDQNPGEEPTPVPPTPVPPPPVPGTDPDADVPVNRPGDSDPDVMGETNADPVDAPVAGVDLWGSTGKDILTGSAGDDIFHFGRASLGKHRDTIIEFTPGSDLIDLSGIDANVKVSGNGAFKALLAGSKAFTKAGQLRYDAKTGILSGNTDKDAAAEFQLVLKNKPLLLTLDDFVL